MTEAINETCPLCGTMAHYFPEDYDNRKHFFCPQCTEFELSRFAEDVILKSPGTLRAETSEAARNAPEGTYYCLTKPTSGMVPMPANTDLVGRYVKRRE